MTAPDHMPEMFENRLHEPGHPHMEPPANTARFSFESSEQSAVLPDEFLLRVARQIRRGPIGEDDRVIGLSGVGDQHRHAGRLEGGRERILQQLIRDQPIASIPRILNPLAIIHPTLPPVCDAE